MIDQHGAALTDDFVPCAVMQDYKEGNVVVERARDSWRVSGVFDLMQMHFADGEPDLSRQTAAYLDEDPALARAFVQAYLDRRPPRPGFADRFPLHMLDDRLILWGFFQRMEWWTDQRTLRQWAAPYTAALQTIGL